MAEVAGKTGYVKTFDVGNDGLTIASTDEANPCEVTTSGSHGYSTGDVIWLQDIYTSGDVAVDDLNNKHFVITKVSATEFTLDDINASGYGAGDSGTATLITATLGLKNWTLPQVANVGDTTDFESSGLKEFLLTLKEWSGTFNGSINGTPLTLGYTYVLCLGLSASNEYYGSIILSGIDPNVVVADVNVIGYSFQGTSTLTYS